jgi:hypothetical protein
VLRGKKQSASPAPFTMETAMSTTEAPISPPERAPAPPQKRRSIAITWQIIIAVLLFDVAGAGTILGLGEAQATQRQQAVLSFPMDHAPSSAQPGHARDGHD